MGPRYSLNPDRRTGSPTGSQHVLHLDIAEAFANRLAIRGGHALCQRVQRPCS